MDRGNPGERGSRDRRIVGLNPPDESLHQYERAVYELLLGTGESQREVLLAQLRAGEALDLTPVRDGLYTDVVDHGWFSRAPTPSETCSGGSVPDSG